jgi:hypothetical protein
VERIEKIVIVLPLMIVVIRQLKNPKNYYNF